MLQRVSEQRSKPHSFNLRVGAKVEEEKKKEEEGTSVRRAHVLPSGHPAGELGLCICVLENISEAQIISWRK